MLWRDPGRLNRIDGPDSSVNPICRSHELAEWPLKKLRNATDRPVPRRESLMQRQLPLRITTVDEFAIFSAN